MSTNKLGVGAIIEHPSLGEGAIFGQQGNHFRIYFKDHGEKILDKNYPDFELIEESEEVESAVTLDDILSAVQELSAQSKTYFPVELGGKWDGGTLILQPESSELKNKEFPIDSFFHKIVMVRDRLRVLEQNINSHKKLTDEEKVNLQQYITRAYGSLTSFNVLFANKEDYFVGSRS